MNKAAKFRALVVDDEDAVRKLLVLALTRQGFECDAAADGAEAEQRVAECKYDAVVTDLRMPNKHGHALATHLLSLKPKPVTVVHTGVIEPRLAKDLFARGVDDVVFKPSNFEILAIKVKALVERGSQGGPHRDNAADSIEEKTDELSNNLQVDASIDGVVTLPQLESKLAGLSQILPLSNAALDVYKMTNSDEAESSHLAAAIQRDAAFAAEVLRLANSSFYNATGQPIVYLERAVVRIGQKRIGELALAMNALASMTSRLVPWMNVRLVWKQSMAAGLAAEMLVEQGKHNALEEGLLLSAIMHPLGRVILGTLYPGRYEAMLKQCLAEGESLQNQERNVFPLSHSEVLGQLLATWNVPARVQSPLRFQSEEYAIIAKTSEPTRTQAELIKLATFIGRIAVGQWEAWDTVELPPATLIKRLGIGSLSKIVDQTSVDVNRLAAFHAGRSEAAGPARSLATTRQLAYCNLSEDPFDFLERMLPPMRIEPIACSKGDLGNMEKGVLVNCIGVAPHQLATQINRSSKCQFLIVTDPGQVREYSKFGRAIALPSSYGRLRSACWEASPAVHRAGKLAGAVFSERA
jgi:HD-like signal output (HDOD) protein/DNA-binding response OmpR family regulator